MFSRGWCGLCLRKKFKFFAKKNSRHKLCKFIRSTYSSLFSKNYFTCTSQPWEGISRYSKHDYPIPCTRKNPVQTPCFPRYPQIQLTTFLIITYAQLSVRVRRLLSPKKKSGILKMLESTMQVTKYAQTNKHNPMNSNNGGTCSKHTCAVFSLGPGDDFHLQGC